VAKNSGLFSFSNITTLQQCEAGKSEWKYKRLKKMAQEMKVHIGKYL
jgi:hypothetical protein